MEALTVTSCFLLEASMTPTEDRQMRERGTQLGRGGSSFAVMTCVIFRVTGAGAGQAMNVPPNVFSRKDRSADGTRGKGSKFCTLFDAGIGITLDKGRRDPIFGTTVGTRPGRDACLVGTPGTDNRSSVDVGSGIGSSFFTGVFFEGAYRFVETLLTTNGLELAIV
jgi:hypothetical protein